MSLPEPTHEELLQELQRLRERIASLEADVQRARQTEAASHARRQTRNEEQRFLRRLLETMEQQRELVAYEIHDGLAQLLAAAWQHLQVFRDLQTRDPEGARKALDAVADLLQRSVAEARNLISGLRPPALDESGMVPAIEYLVWQSQESGGPRIEFYPQVHSQRLAGPLEIAVFRIIQEALTNARRHSHSDRVRVDLIESADALRIEVRDWGVGFDPGQVPPEHVGLEGIRHRAMLLGGTATIHSAPGEGTQIVFEIPLPEPASTPPPPPPAAGS